MSFGTRLKSWPACVRAVDWSHDGIIALASDAQVELLFPTTQFQDEEHLNPQWQHFAIQVSWFSDVELPKREPAPLQTFSVGEEISTSYPAEIAWSPPGLAKHRSCALAVLTSNLVLSIWTSEGKVQDAESWDRRLLINNTLTNFFSADASEDQSHNVSDTSEKLRLCKRVRTFTWASPLPTDRAVGIIGTQLSWSKHIIAIANDDNQVVLVKVNSPTSTLAGDSSWNAEVLSYFSLRPDAGQFTTNQSMLDDLMGQQRHISSLSWSPWVNDGGEARSIIAYATNYDVCTRTISYSQQKISFGPEVVYTGSEVRFAGPMTWSPECRDGRMLLALFRLTEVVFLTMSVQDASVVDERSHRMDGRWDIISGVAWDVLNDSTLRLHFASQTASTRCPTVALEISPKTITDISALDWPYWREQINGSQGHFSANHDLKGHANAKVWGISASPLGDFIVACHTVHPTDMIEYGTPSDRWTNVVVTKMRSQGVTLDFPMKAISAESILNTARKWVESNVESSDDLPLVQAEIHQKLTKTYGPVQEPSYTDGHSGARYESNDIGIILRTFKHRAFLGPNTLKDRYKILTSRVCAPSEPFGVQKTLIAFRLAKELQNLPSHLYLAHSFSVTILQTHHQLIRLVQDVLHDTVTDVMRAMNDSEISTETCTFCDGDIPFTDPFSATCDNGHQFIRCGLSFLTIQGPNITKHCGLCTAPFFSDAYVSKECIADLEHEPLPNSPHDLSHPERTEEDINARTPRELTPKDSPTGQRLIKRTDQSSVPLSLARVLFLACDVCIYCGGKFVG